MKKHKIKIKYIIVLLLTVATFVIPLAIAPIQAHAAGNSWLQGTSAYNDLYGTPVQGYTVDVGSGLNMDWLGEQIGNLIMFLCKGIWRLADNTSGTYAVNLTLEGIVLGKAVIPQDSPNLYGFDLTKGNYYGIVGSTIYAILRSFAYAGVFVMFLFFLARNLFDNTPKARDTLKDSISNSVISLALLTLMPPITELVIFLRDSILKQIATGLRESNGGNSLLQSVQILFNTNDENKLIAAIVFAALTVGVIFYAKDYISIALQQTILFGFFPLFNVLGTGKKKFISDWANTFFANMAVPLIDIMILWIPYRILAKYNSSNMPLIVCVIVVMIIWASRQVRQEILKMFGSLTSSPVGKGMGGLGQMVQLARMGSMLGQRAAGAATGAVASAAGAFAGIGGAGSESNSASVDSASMSDASKDIMGSDFQSASRADDSMLENPNTEDTKLSSNLDDEINEEFGGGTRDTDDIESASDASDEMYDEESADIAESMSDLDDIETGADDIIEGVDDELEGYSDTDAGELVTDDEPGNIAAAETTEPVSASPEFTAADTSEPVSASSEATSAQAQAMVPEGLNDFDTNRWNNLHSLDEAKEEYSSAQKMSDAHNANLARFDSGESMSDASGMDKDFSRNIEAHRAKLASIDKQIADNESEHIAREFASGSHSEADNAQYTKRKAELETERNAAIRDLDNDRQKIVNAKNSAEQRMNTAQDKIDKYSQREEKFASVSEQYGMSGRTYESTNEMNSAIRSRDARVDAMREKARKMNLSKEDMKGFTPEARQEMMQLQMERIITREALGMAHKIGTEAIKRKVTTTTKVAGAVLGTGLAIAGAGAFAYGGEEASMAGAQIGGYAGSGVGRAVGNRINRRIDRASQTASFAYNSARTFNDAGLFNAPKAKTTKKPVQNKPTSGTTGGQQATKPAPQTTSTTPKSGIKNEATSSSPIEEVGSRGASQIKLDK